MVDRYWKGERTGDGNGWSVALNIDVCYGWGIGVEQRLARLETGKFVKEGAFEVGEGHIWEIRKGKMNRMRSEERTV